MTTQFNIDVGALDRDIRLVVNTDDFSALFEKWIKPRRGDNKKACARYIAERLHDVIVAWGVAP